MRVGNRVWHASRTNDFNAEIPNYNTPKEIVTRFNYLTVMPASSRGLMEVIKSGETLYDTWTVIANSAYFDNVFNVGDLMWVDGHSPNTELEEMYGNGATANAIVKNVSQVNFSISIVLTRNQNQVLI